MNTEDIYSITVLWRGPYFPWP